MVVLPHLNVDGCFIATHAHITRCCHHHVAVLSYFPGKCCTNTPLYTCLLKLNKSNLIFMQWSFFFIALYLIQICKVQQHSNYYDYYSWGPSTEGARALVVCENRIFDGFWAWKYKNGINSTTCFKLSASPLRFRLRRWKCDWCISLRPTKKSCGPMLLLTQEVYHFEWNMQNFQAL